MNISKNLKNYDLMAVIRGMAGMSRTGDDTALAYELSREMELRHPERDTHHSGFFLPSVDLMREAGIIREGITSTAGEETLGTLAHGTTDGIGGYGTATVETAVLVAQFIDALAAKTVLGKAGAMRLNNLVGNVAIPKVASGINAGWVALEGGNVPKKNPTLAQVLLTPHTVGAYTDITRKLAVQSGDVVTALVLRLLQEAISRKVEDAAFNGSGSNGEPLGFTAAAGVNTVSLTAGAVAKSDLLDFINALETDNVDTSEGCCWIGSPDVKKLLAGTIDLTAVKNVEGTENVGGVARKYLYENGRVEDFPFFTSNLAPAKKLIFMKAADLVLASWGAISLTVDQYTLSTSGTIRIVSISEWDIALRHDESVAIGTALS